MPAADFYKSAIHVHNEMNSGNKLIAQAILKHPKLPFIPNHELNIILHSHKQSSVPPHKVTVQMRI